MAQSRGRGERFTACGNRRSAAPLNPHVCRGVEAFAPELKCTKSDTFPIVGFVETLGARPRKIASLYVGRRDGGRVLYAGTAGIGYTEKVAARAAREARSTDRADIAARGAGEEAQRRRTDTAPSNKVHIMQAT